MPKLTRVEVRKEAKRLADAMGLDAPDLEELIEIGFGEASTEVKGRLILASQARNKCGKSHWAIHTTPQPVGVLDLDVGLEGVIEKRKPGRLIIAKKFPRRREYELSGQEYKRKDAEEDLKEIREAYRALVSSEAIRTVVVDTGGELWEIVRMFHFGKLTKVMPHDYGPANADMRALVQLPYLRDNLNAVFIHKIKKEYINDKWKGGWELTGQKETPFLVQCNIEHFKTIGDKDEGEEDQFGIRIIDSRHTHEFDGEELTGKMCSFERLARLLLPSIPKENWR